MCSLGPEGGGVWQRSSNLHNSTGRERELVADGERKNKRGGTTFS